jgi:hypothetical protein
MFITFTTEDLHVIGEIHNSNPFPEILAIHLGEAWTFYLCLRLAIFFLQKITKNAQWDHDILVRTHQNCILP